MKGTFKTALKVVLAVTILGLAAVSAYAAAYTKLKELPGPDARNAMVYFHGWKSSKAQLWDGEFPIGTYRSGTTGACIPYLARPGAHTFVARSTNYAHIKMNLQANRIYYVRIEHVSIAVPTVVKIYQITKDEEESYRKRWNIKDISFTDEWREKFLAYKDGKWLKEMKEALTKMR
ncbi:MAG: hypothetical protein LBH07_01510 [Treponema sp.]|nr:hypothetical protein [Treponema sp.]